MPRHTDPGFSNEYAEGFGFPSSGAMQQNVGRAGLPPQRRQIPFEHQQAQPAPENQSVPYNQPVLQGSPAAQGSQFRVQPKELSPAVASFLRANSIQQGAIGVDQRLAELENRMAAQPPGQIGGRSDAAARPIAQMRSGQEAERRLLADTAQLSRGVAPTAGYLPMIQPGDFGQLFPQGPVPRPQDEPIMFQPAPGGAPVFSGDTQTGIGMDQPDYGFGLSPDKMMEAAFPGGFTPAPIEDRVSRFKTFTERAEDMDDNPDSPDAQGEPPAGPVALQPGSQPIGDIVPDSVPTAEQFGAPDDAVIDEPGVAYDTSAAGDITKSAGPGTAPLTAKEELQKLNDELGKLLGHGGKISKGIIQQAEKQIQKQQDHLANQLSEAGGALMAGGSPLVLQQAMDTVNAMTEAQYKVGLAELQGKQIQANIYAQIMRENGMSKRADDMLNFNKTKHDDFVRNRDIIANANLTKMVVDMLTGLGLVPSEEAIEAITNSIVTGEPLTEEERAMFLKVEAEAEPYYVPLTSNKKNWTKEDKAAADKYLADSNKWSKIAGIDTGDSFLGLLGGMSKSLSAEGIYAVLDSMTPAQRAWLRGIMDNQEMWAGNPPFWEEVKEYILSKSTAAQKKKFAKYFPEED